MFTYTTLPIDFFERQLNDKKLYIDLYKYHVKSMKEEGFEVDGQWYSVESLEFDEGVEKFYVPSLIYGAEKFGHLRGIDVIVYAYLSFLACKNKNGSFKMNIGEIYSKTKIRKTEIKTSINKLETMGFIKPTRISGNFSIEEIENLLLNPKEANEFDKLMDSFLSRL